MFKKTFFKSAVAMAACSFMFAACGSDSGSSADDEGLVEESSSSIESSAEKKPSSSAGETLLKENLTISGVSQKGPFISGTIVIGQELDGKTLKQTGRSFRGKINNDKGEFDISSVSLVSQYVIIDATGYYLNEVTGTASKSTITLNALVDLSDRNTVNVNLLTHLEYERVAQLVSEGKEIGAAKKQAQGEILKAFNIEGVDVNSEDLSIFGNSTNSAALLAVSVLMQGNRSEGELTGLLTDFANDLKKDGKWDDETSKGKVADWAMRTDLSGKLENIRTNVESWNLGKVPNFEKIVVNFWKTFYGVGECNAAAADEQVKIKGTDNVFVCEDGIWKLATVTESGLVYVSFDEPEEAEKTVFDDLDMATVGVGNLWDVTKGVTVDYGSDYKGHWFAYNDRAADGSSIYMDSKGKYAPAGQAPSFMTEAGVKEDKGIAFGFQLLNFGTSDEDIAYLGVGLTVNDATGDIADIDISSWKGLCVVYTSTVPFTIQFNDRYGTGFYNEVAVPASRSTTVLNLPWKAFGVPSWAKEYNNVVVIDGTPSMDNATTKFSGISFLFYDDQIRGVIERDNLTITAGAANIKAIGKLDGCSTK